MTKFILIGKFADTTGYTEKAVYRKIEEGVWIEGVHYVRRAGRIHINIEAYEQWVEGQPLAASK